MNKIANIILCFILLMAQVVPVYAQDMVQNSDGSAIPQETTGDMLSEETHTHSYDRLISDSATCGQGGIAIYACTCGAETQISSQPTGNHSYGTDSYIDTSKHKKVCTVCGDERHSDHSWDSGHTVTEANCMQDGEQVFTCSDCGGTYSRKIPKTGHHYDPGISDNVYHVCSVCQSIQSHAWDAGEVTRRPTCKESGTFEYYCSICEMTLVEALAKLTTHTYDSACDPDCNVCGVKREIEHTFATAWSKNYKGHWHECTKCGEQKDFASHHTGPEATEETEQVCLTCKYVVTPKKDHVHKYDAQWSYDEVGHWHECTGCKNEKDYSSHKFDSSCDAVCNVCGFEREEVHSYDNGWQMSNFEHWQICSLCGEESSRERHIPGPEASAQTAQMCMVCAFELEPKQEHIHVFGPEWKQTDDGHWQVCSCGQQSVPESHVWVAGEEHRNGKVTYFCTECGMERQVEAAGSSSVTVLLLILLALVCVGGIAALIVIMRKKEESQEEIQPLQEMNSDADPDEFESDHMMQ